MHVLTEAGSEDDDSPALSLSSVHTDLSAPEQLASPSSDQPVSELHSPHPGSSPAPDTLYSPEFNATDSKQVKTGSIHSFVKKKKKANVSNVYEFEFLEQLLDIKHRDMQSCLHLTSTPQLH